MMRVVLLAVLCLLACGAAPQAEPATMAFAEQAQAAYDRGMSLRATDPAASHDAFRQSARDWQRVVDAGASNGPLHFNLGNAHMQAGDLGRAIASYLRAERSMPGNHDLEQNLKQARSRVQHAFARGGGTLLVDSVARWWHLVPRGAREAAAWLAWTVFWATLLATLLAPGVVSGTPIRDAARKLVLAGSLVLWCIFGGTLIADQLLGALRPQGVLVESDVVLRKGNGDGFDPAFAESLSPGVEFGILEERPGWWRIELPDTRTGWIKTSQGERVG
ncbi:MAG: hypothetical protein JNK53_03225 [Phycisphaerae bacterium]|nr:hypothetical protein [Phycisphaerae bacterium]